MARQKSSKKAQDYHQREQRITKALRVYKQGPNESFASVHERFPDISKTTLYERFHGGTSKVMAQRGVLSYPEERAVVERVIWLSDLGFPPKKADIKALIRCVLRARKTPPPEPVHIGENLVFRMKRRYTDLQTTTSRNISATKLIACQLERVSGYIDNYEYWSAQYNIKNKNKWNMDETGYIRGFCDN